MRKIDKGPEPSSLTRFKLDPSNKSKSYKDLSELERQDIRDACTREQLYLCAYCCQRISGGNTDTMNEHVEAQKLAPQRTLDFSNLVASCTTQGQCDAAHGSQVLPLTPLMPECETALRFKLSGRVDGLTPRAEEAIRVLNLGDSEQNNKALIEKRKQLIDTLIWTFYGRDQAQLELEIDENLIRMMIHELATPQHGKLEAFAPVLANILNGRIAV